MLPKRGPFHRFMICLIIALSAGFVLQVSAEKVSAQFEFLHNGSSSIFDFSLDTEDEVQSATESSMKAQEAEGAHTSLFSSIMIELALIIVVAMIGRWLAGRFNQPAVMGELLFGVIVGNVAYWLHNPFFFLVMHLDSAMQIFGHVWQSGLSISGAVQQVFSADELAPGGIGTKMIHILTGHNALPLMTMVFALWLFSNFGVILLLFMVGLESSVEEMLRVGGRAILVAMVGVIIPFVLGLLASMWLIPGAAMPVHIFLGATLCATSVGITARLFKDLHKLRTPEAKVILGAAVLNDILGLIILAVVIGIVTTGEVHIFGVIRILLLSFLFFAVVIVLGDRLVRWNIPLARQLDPVNYKTLFPYRWRL